MWRVSQWTTCGRLVERGNGGDGVCAKYQDKLKMQGETHIAWIGALPL